MVFVNWRLVAVLQTAKSLPGIYHGDAMACCNIDPSTIGFCKRLSTVIGKDKKHFSKVSFWPTKVWPCALSECLFAWPDMPPSSFASSNNSVRDGANLLIVAL